MRYGHFLKTALKDSRVGTFFASSRYVARELASHLRKGDKYVVEYGAGDGIITKEILRSLPPDGRLVAIETNPDFISELKRIKDRRLAVVSGDVADVLEHIELFNLPRVDVVISGIPLSFLKPRQRELVIEKTAAALAPYGMLLVYQHRLLILPLLKKHFRRVELDFEPRNFLPYFIFKAVK
ncbi:MAG: methyltransferase [Patescibacteria group bacterium]